MNGELRMAKSEWIGRHEPTPHSAFSIQHSAFRAFTLVEMVIVIGIIILLAGLVLPAASQMWRDRKLADAQNMVSGMLMVARAKALEGNAGETGLFFYLDDQGVQHVAAISQDPNSQNETDQTKIITGWQIDNRWYNVFTISNTRNYSLPAPMRVVPVYVVCPNTDGIGICNGKAKFELFDKATELTNNDFTNVVISDASSDVAQAHRNFFSVIFSPNGELRTGRDVLIRDLDDDFDKNPGADVTGLRVNGPPDGPWVTRYYRYENNNSPDDLIGFGAVRLVGSALKDQPPTWLVTDKAGVALNFPSIDGLLVYDDSLFNEAGDAEARRKFLLESAQPFYIQRLTGAVVRGPVGEVPATP